MARDFMADKWSSGQVAVWRRERKDCNQEKALKFLSCFLTTMQGNGQITLRRTGKTVNTHILVLTHRQNRVIFKAIQE